jgi:ABC-type uncharacterized transport system ATPase subunit
VSLRGAVKRFGTVTAVAGIDVTIAPGEVVAFLGPNGAGKTSTLDMLLGLSRPTAGDVAVFGRNPVDAVTHGMVAAVMQTGGLLGGRDAAADRIAVPLPEAGGRGDAARRDHRDRGSPGRQVLRR